MLKQEKERVVADLVERLRASDTLIVADYRGLTMPEIDGVRTEVLKHGARFTVVKNTLTKRAAEEAGVPELVELLDGPTAIAFVGDGDMVGVAKALLENYATVLDEIVRAKPSAAKGRYIRTITLTTSMGPGIHVDPQKTRGVVEEMDEQEAAVPA